MSITFAWRSDTSTGDAWFANGEHTMVARRYGVTGAAGTEFLSATSANVIGGAYMASTDLSTTANAINFSARRNADASSKKISALVRYIPNYNGQATVNNTPLVISSSQPIGKFGPTLLIASRTTGTFEFWAYDSSGNNRHNGTVMTGFSATSGEPVDLFFTAEWGAGTTASYAFYYNGSLQTSSSISWTNTYDDVSHFDMIQLGSSGIYGNGLGGYNEVVVWDSLENPASINTVTPAGVTTTGDSLDGASRDGWVDVAFKHGTSWDSIPASQIGIGFDQIQAGVTQSGSLDTGGPAAAAGTATALDIPNIKEQVRWILDTNNTTTSSVLNLSASMSKTVQVVQKVNPQKLSLQSTLYPAVTVFTKNKSMKPATIAKNQLNGKREAKLTLTVVGMVWNQNFSADINNDPADQDLEYLMENIERILRSYHDLGSNVTWQIPTDVVYHTAAFDEQSHFRVGFLDIEITVFY